jgi:hypothetical protein
MARRTNVLFLGDDEAGDRSAAPPHALRPNWTGTSSAGSGSWSGTKGDVVAGSHPKLDIANDEYWDVKSVSVGFPRRVQSSRARTKRTAYASLNNDHDR